MGWVFHNAYETFDQYRDLWDEINRTQGNHILLDSKFVGPLVRYFASRETLLGISSDHTDPAMVLVEKRGKGFWQTFQPAQAPLGLILLGKRNDIMGQIRELLRSFPGYALGLGILQQDPNLTIFRDLEQFHNVETLEYIKTARLSLTGTFEEYWKSRGKNLIHNLSRQRRRLEERGTCLELIADRDPSRVAECIREYEQLEANGWKAREGTAIRTSSNQGMFYREILENFCQFGEGVIYRITMDGKTIASDICLERDRAVFILKTAYDESIKGISPGLLIHQEIFKLLFFNEKIKSVEFYGRILDWHMKWTNEIRTMSHVNFYRYPWVVILRRLYKTYSKSKFLRDNNEKR